MCNRFVIEVVIISFNEIIVEVKLIIGGGKIIKEEIGGVWLIEIIFVRWEIVNVLW